jgi:hypothetical protein
MTKDEALKMAIEAIEFKGVRDSEEYWQMMDVTKNSCKEALEQPLTRDWKDTIDERIARDSEFKEALDQPTVAELNDEYLRDTYVEGLNQPVWQGLSDVELSLLAEKYTGADGVDVVDYGRAVEQALKDKNNG